MAETVNAILIDTESSASLWGDAEPMASYIRNRVSHCHDGLQYVFGLSVIRGVNTVGSKSYSDLLSAARHIIIDARPEG